MSPNFVLFKDQLIRRIGRSKRCRRIRFDAFQGRYLHGMLMLLRRNESVCGQRLLCR